MNTETYKDEHLMPLLTSNSKLDRIKLYELCAAPLYGVICRIIENEELAEKILTQAFLMIYQPAFYNQPSNLMLFTRMINLTRKLAVASIERVSVNTAKKEICFN